MAEVSAFVENNQVRFRNPETGRLGWVDSDKANEAARLGLIPVTPEEHFAEERRRELDRPGLAAAAALARGVTLGLSDVLLTETGAVSPETLRGLAEESPVASGAGEVAGVVAPALLSGGTLSAPALAGAAARGVAGRVAARAGTGLAGRVAAKALPETAAAIAEGAVIGLGSGISDVALERGTAGQIAAKTAEGAVLGGAFGLGLLGVGAAATGTARGVKRALKLTETKTARAKAAEALLGAETSGVTTVDPRAAMAQLQLQVPAMQSARTRLKQLVNRGEATADDIAALNELEPVLRARSKMLRELQDESRGIRKARAAERPKPAQGETPSYRQVVDDQFDDISKKLETNQKLTFDEQVKAFEPEMARVAKELDELDAIIKVGQTGNRRLNRQLLREQADTVTGSVDDIADDVYGWAIAQRSVKRAEKAQLDQMVQRLSRQNAQAEGQALRGTQLVREVERVIAEVPLAAQQTVKAPRAALEALSQETQSVLGRLAGETSNEIGQFFRWRSAGTVLGFAMGNVPGAILGAVAGARPVQQFAGQLAGKTLAGLSAGAALSGRALQVPRIGITTGMLRGADDVKALADDLKQFHKQPDQIYAATKDGYMDAGISPHIADTMATMKAGRIQAIRDALPKNPSSPTELAKLKDVVRASNDPRGITQRVADSAMTEGDWDVVTKAMPQVASALTAVARETLATGKSLPSDTRRMLERMAGQEIKTRVNVQTIQQIAYGQGGEQLPQSRRVVGIPSAATGPAAAASLLRS